MSADALTRRPRVRDASGEDPIAIERRRWESNGHGHGAAMATATAIFRVNDVVMRMTEDAIAPLGLTFARFFTLSVLSRAAEQTMALGELSELLGVRPASTTGMVSALELQGFVQRTRASNDRRFIYARLLPAGREVVASAERLISAHVLEAMPWSESEMDSLYDLLAKMRRLAGDFS